MSAESVTAGDMSAGGLVADGFTAGSRFDTSGATPCAALADRARLSVAALSGALVRPGGFWHEIAVTGLTGSTNADMVARAAHGAAEGSVLVAEEQSAGRGRMGRAWLSPPGAALMFSVLLRPASVRVARRGWIPLLAGVAVAAAVRSLAGLDARLKWPNDVLVDGRKLAGILAEQAGDAVVVGVGINVSTRLAELPVRTATSLLLEGAASTDRHRLLGELLAQIERRYLDWLAADPGACGLRAEYRRCCDTLGRPVSVDFPGGTTVTGTALDVDADGRLLLRTAEGQLAVSAGDVVHLR
jgi:BirA family transcriptional regulator, biotin operon repressor / biotin---[acetyl-CoA-carboxylase] ligase